MWAAEDVSPYIRSKAFSSRTEQRAGKHLPAALSFDLLLSKRETARRTYADEVMRRRSSGSLTQLEAQLDPYCQAKRSDTQ